MPTGRVRGRDGGQGLPQEGLRGVRVARGEGETTDRGDRGGERTRRRLRSAEARVAVFVGSRHGERGGIAPLGGGGVCGVGGVRDVLLQVPAARRVSLEGARAGAGVLPRVHALKGTIPRSGFADEPPAMDNRTFLERTEENTNSNLEIAPRFFWCSSYAGLQQSRTEEVADTNFVLLPSPDTITCER